MNATTHPEQNALQTVSAPAESQHFSANSLMMNPETMDRAIRIAEMMANGKSTVPVHLQKNPADCLAVVLQSMTWGMLPHIVAQKTHLVNGTLGYEAQLVNAVVQASGSIQGRFHYEYKGTSPKLECRVGAIIRGENEITWGNWLSEDKVTIKNSPLWKVNPPQQMGYLQVKNWARLYCPGAILGVYSPDEFDAPAPRDMGQAEVVRPTVSQELLDIAQAAAERGVAAYQTFWKDTGKDNRKLLDSEHERLKGVAIKADKARTVETAPSQTAQPATTDTTTGEVTVTFEQMIQKLDKATSEDGLYVAMDWSSAMDDQSRIGELEAHFNARLEQLRK